MHGGVAVKVVVRAATAVALACSAAAACKAAAQEPIQVGLIAPLSGGSADFGTSALRGAQLAVDEINGVGGLLGRPLQLVVRDDHGDPAAGEAAALELVDQRKVAFTVGFCNTGVAMAALDIFQSRKHVLLVPCAQGTAVTKATPAAASYVFRMAPSDEMNASFLVREIVERRKLTRVAILADSTAYGSGGVADITAELAKHQLQPVHVARFALGVTTLQQELKQAKASGAQALVVYTVGPEQAVAATSRRELRWDVPFYAPWTLSFKGVLDAAGPDALEGTMMTQSIINDLANERRATFVARYARQTQSEPIGSLMAAAQSYDAVHLAMRALFRSRGDTSGDGLKQALENLPDTYQGVVTYRHPFSSQDHEAFSSNMVWLGVWRKGSIRYYYPEDAKLSAEVRRK